MRTLRRSSDTIPIPGDVLSCLGELGIEVIRQVENEAVAKCPMHRARTGKPDAHPSWSVLIEDRRNGRDNIPAGTMNCFSCGYKGSFVALVRDVLHLDWGEATAWVRARGGIDRARMVLDRQPRTTDLDTSAQVNEASLALFIAPPAEALAKRGLSAESASHYGVLWDTDRGSWIIPIRDPDTARLIGWQEKNERFFRNRPRSVRKSQTLFGYDVFDRDTAVLVESPLDCLRLRTAGVLGGLASYGVAVSDAQMELVRAVADVVVIALDLDRDGERFSRDLQQRWSRRGLVVRFLNYEGIKAKDIGDMNDAQINAAVGKALSSTIVRF